MPDLMMSSPSPRDPRARLDDLRHLPDGYAQWQNYIDRLLDDAVANVAALLSVAPEHAAVTPQFFNPSRRMPPGHAGVLPILWNAFPRNLLARHGRDKALAVADMLWPLGATDEFDPTSSRFAPDLRHASRWMRPQDEYCEWRVERDPRTQRIQRVVFTAEAPEYWQALHGGALASVRDGDSTSFTFRGDATLVSHLYRRLLGKRVTEVDLLHDGVYDVSNRWNTTHGIVHLCHPNNRLAAQVRLCADSSVPVRSRAGGFITDANALCAARSSGRLNSHSDPTISGTVNALARNGASLSLAEPVGLCIDDVDISGWRLPDDTPPSGCLHIVRGAPGRVLRLVVQAPTGSRWGIDALTIGDEPLLHGGQIAECITMKAVALVVLPATPGTLTPLDATHRAYVSKVNPRLLQVRPAAEDPPTDGLPAFARDLPAPPPAANPNP